MSPSRRVRGWFQISTLIPKRWSLKTGDLQLEQHQLVGDERVGQMLLCRAAAGVGGSLHKRHVVKVFEAHRNLAKQREMLFCFTVASCCCEMFNHRSLNWNLGLLMQDCVLSCKWCRVSCDYYLHGFMHDFINSHRLFLLVGKSGECFM